MWNWLLHDPIWVGNSIMSRGNLIVLLIEWVIYIGTALIAVGGAGVFLIRLVRRKS